MSRSNLQDRPMKITKNIGMLLLAVKSLGCGKSESRNNDATKIEHQTIGVRHDRHVTCVASGGANETDNFVFPYAASELDHVLRCGRNIVIVNRCSNEDAVSAFNSRA